MKLLPVCTQEYESVLMVIQYEMFFLDEYT